MPENFANLSLGSQDITAKMPSSSPIRLQLKTIDDGYTPKGGITYVASIVNTSFNSIRDAMLFTDLGSHDGKKTLSLCGRGKLYVNGDFSGEIEGREEEGFAVFKILRIGTNDNINLWFKAKPTTYAGLETGSVIKNRVSLKANGLEKNGEAEVVTPVECYTDIIMFKAQNTDQSDMVYLVYNLYNYGNTAATDTVLTDTFSPPVFITGVFVDENPVKVTDYTYINGAVRLPGIAVPSATFNRTPSGEVVTYPGKTEVTISARP